MNRWGSDGPPPEAYSRVSDPERFRPLHDIVLTLLEQLQAAFKVERLEGCRFDSELQLGGLARPSVRLVTGDSKAAPLTIAFTIFPGLKVRAGRWRMDAFPACGCDACDETANDEATRLKELVDAVTAGRFRESISLPLAGNGWVKSEYWSSRQRRSSGSRVDRVRACDLAPGPGLLLESVTGSTSAFAGFSEQTATFVGSGRVIDDRST